MPRSRSQPLVLARRGELVAQRDPLRASGRLLRQADMDASYVDLADPAHLEFDYMRWMRIVLLAARARRNLHIGGGACALPRALASRDPGGLQEVCEIDPDVLTIAREHFGLRRTPGLRVRQADGRGFLAGRPPASYDAAVIDAFLGARLPPALIARDALAELARVARLVMINVVDDRSARVVNAVSDDLAEVHPRVWGVSGRGGNTVLVAGRLGRPSLDRIAADLAGDTSPARLVEIAHR